LVPGFSPKNLEYFQNIFLIEIKLKLKSILHFDFCFVSKLIWSKNRHWYKTSAQTFHKTTYHNVISARRAIKFLDLDFLYIAKARDKINLKRLDKETISVQKLYNTANQNNSDIYSYYTLHFTFLNETLKLIYESTFIPECNTEMYIYCK